MHLNTANVIEIFTWMFEMMANLIIIGVVLWIAIVLVSSIKKSKKNKKK